MMATEVQRRIAGVERNRAPRRHATAPSGPAHRGAGGHAVIHQQDGLPFDRGCRAVSAIEGLAAAEFC